MFLSIHDSIYSLFKNVRSSTNDVGEAKAPLESNCEASSSIVLFMCSFDKRAHRKNNCIYVTMSSSSSFVSRSDSMAENKRERAKRDGWLKMVHQEILDKQNELFEINGDASTIGVIKEIIKLYFRGLIEICITIM
jgi:hypothetical protein